jgi:ketosteroid isomerase-like protein
MTPDTTPVRAAKRQVLAANDAFYKAMREGDYAAMERLWAERRTVTCTHPDWHMLVGREAVMESWRVILTEHEPPEIWPTEAQAIVTGSTAMVLCTERIGGLELVASNGFVREGARWRILNHQSAHAPAESTQ